MDQRSSYIDNIKGILVLLVVLCHILANSIQYSRIINAIYIFIYTFHIPLFVFISGYLSKNIKARDMALFSFLGLYLFTSMGSTLFSDIVYFVFYNGFTLNLLVSNIVYFIKDTIFSLFLATGPSWYLLSLIIWRLITPHFNKKRLLIFSVLAALIVGGVSQIEYAMSLSRTIVFFPFYLLGYLFDKKFFMKIADLSNRILFKCLAILILIGIIILDYFNNINYQMLYSFSSYATCGYSFIHGVLIRCYIIILALIISFCFLMLIPKKEIITTQWGRKSINIYIWHIFLLPLVSILESKLHLNAWFSIITIVISISACIIFSTEIIDKFTEKIKNSLNRLIYGSVKFNIS